jgi:hypothetical protein
MTDQNLNPNFVNNDSQIKNNRTSFRLPLIFLIIEISALLLVGLSMGLLASGFFSPLIILYGLVLPVLPLLGVVGVGISVYSFIKKRAVVIAILLLIFSVILIPRYLNTLMTTAIAHILNPSLASPTDVANQEKKAYEQRDIEGELIKAHYDYYKNLFATNSVTVFREPNGYILKTNHRFNIMLPNIQLYVDDGPLDAHQKEIVKKQWEIIDEISGKNIQLELPPFNIFAAQYAISFDATEKIRNEGNLELYKDPDNKIWDQINLQMPIVGELGWRGR